MRDRRNDREGKCDTGSDSAYSVVADEPDHLRRNLIAGFADCEGNEDLVLAALDRAEAGTPVLGWGDLRVYLDMYPDGRWSSRRRDGFKDDQQDNPPQIVITIAEARKLILDWIAARDKWYAEREAQRAAAGQSK